MFIARSLFLLEDIYAPTTVKVAHAVVIGQSVKPHFYRQRTAEPVLSASMP
jgi:hypothetical protein